MALGIPTLTAEVADNVVTLTLTCTGAISATFHRDLDDGRPVLRNGLNVAGTGTVEMLDYDAAQNRDLDYYATVTDGTLTKSATCTATGQVDWGGDVLFALDNPDAPIPVLVVSVPELRYSGRQESISVINRADPIVVTDVRQYPSGTLTIATLDADERAPILNLLASGAVIGFSPRKPEYGFTEVWYLSVADVNERRVSPIASRPERLWDIPFQRVTPPPPLVA
jgi:hypothetical protein